MVFGGSGPGGFAAEAVVWSFFPCAIQSLSGTGLRTGFVGDRKPLLKPVELVRGGIAFGDRRLSDTIVDDELHRIE